jgi:rRNA-processing protein FCF1
MKKLFIALDTDFLLALSTSEDSAQQAIDQICQMRGYPIVTPSVMQELADIMQHNDNGYGEIAKNALTQLNTWNILVVDMQPMDHCIADQVASRLLDVNLCVDRQSGLILTEAAIQHAPLLLGYQSNYKQPEKINLLLVNHDLASCTPLQTTTFVEFTNITIGPTAKTAQINS